MSDYNIFSEARAEDRERGALEKYASAKLVKNLIRKAKGKGVYTSAVKYGKNMKVKNGSYKFLGGEEVKVIADSHLDHGVSKDLFNKVMKKMRIKPGEVNVQTFDMGQKVGKDQLVALKKGQKAVFGKRNGRDTFSPLLLDMKPKNTSKLTAIVVPHEGDMVLATIYPGKPSPPSPSKDLPATVLKEAKEFWSKHALAVPSSKVTKSSITTVSPW